MRGFKEPQGIAMSRRPTASMSRMRATARYAILRADDLTLLGRIDLGDDADNVRIDTARSRVLVGYGKGALAVIDPRTARKIADIPLKAHPESFQIDAGGARAFVNVPDAG